MEQTKDPMAGVKTTDFVVLLRISTNKTGGSESNGISAQRRDINLFLQRQERPRVVKEFVEVESGASEHRPVLEEALDLCRKTHSILLVQKVCRLSRDVESLARIVKDKLVDIKVACLPNADNFQIHLYGILAAQERQFISERTKAAMAAAKARGVKFGNPNLGNINKTRISSARKYANDQGKLIKVLRNENKTLREICDVLNKSGIKTRTGKDFHPIQVHRILKRMEVKL